MSNIDKQALRDIAEGVEREEWEVLDNGDDEYQVIVKGSLEKGRTYRSYQPVANEISGQKISAFIAAFSPATALALLDELEADKKRIAELEAKAFNPAILDVIAERQRQQSVEGWTPEHDDEHGNGELAMAAVCYINETGTVNRNGGKPWGWPWDASWWKPDSRRRNMVKAGTLILAEIERIDRAAGIGEGE